MPNSTETTSVAYIFRTGEIWSIDTAILSLYPEGILVGDIEERYKTFFLRYTEILLTLGLTLPFRWIAGISDVKGRRLQSPVYSNRTQSFYQGPECLTGDIIEEGRYEGEEPAVALRRFFEAIYEECGTERPKT